MPSSDPWAASWALFGISLVLAVSLGLRDRRKAPSWRPSQEPLSSYLQTVAGPGEGLPGLGARPLAHGSQTREAPAQPRFSGLRALLAGDPIELQSATEAELASLPEIGEATARRVVAARQAGRLRCHRDLLAVSGIGRHRLRRLLTFVRPLPQVCPSAHPTQ